MYGNMERLETSKVLKYGEACAMSNVSNTLLTGNEGSSCTATKSVKSGGIFYNLNQRP